MVLQPQQPPPPRRLVGVPVVARFLCVPAVGFRDARNTIALLPAGRLFLAALARDREARARARCDNEAAAAPGAAAATIVIEANC